MSPQYTTTIGSISKLISPSNIAAGNQLLGQSPIATMTVSLTGANVHSQKNLLKKTTSNSNGSRKGSTHHSTNKPTQQMTQCSSLQSILGASKNKHQMMKPATLQQMPAKVPQKVDQRVKIATMKPSQSTENLIYTQQRANQVMMSGLLAQTMNQGPQYQQPPRNGIKSTRTGDARLGNYHHSTSIPSQQLSIGGSYMQQQMQM